MVTLQAEATQGLLGPAQRCLAQSAQVWLTCSLTGSHVSFLVATLLAVLQVRCLMPAQTRSAARRTTNELLLAVLRLGHPLGLGLGDALRCRLVCRSWRNLVEWEPHIAVVALVGVDVRGWSLWRPQRLCNLTVAQLDACMLDDLPHLRSMTRLHLEDWFREGPLDLSPLSSLRQLQVLYVDGYATGVAALPAVRRLDLMPASSADVQALRLQTQVSWLGISHDAYPTGGCRRGELYKPGDFDGLGTLRQLQRLELRAMHLQCLGDCSSLACCSSLRHLELAFWSCDCDTGGGDPRSLARLTQIHTLSLVGARGWDYDLPLGQMSSLQELQLDAPEPFVELCESEGFDLPCLSPGRLLLALQWQSWQDAVQVVRDVRNVHEERFDAGLTVFRVLQVTEWPVKTASSHQEAAIQDTFSKLRRSGVTVLSAAAHCASSPVEVQTFGLV